MNIQKVYRRFDHLQRKYRLLAFPLAVVKQYNDDEAGYHAALLTYYGYLALFPLLLISATVTQVVSKSRPELQERVINAVASYFPILGTQLENHIQGLHKSGVALLIGIVILLYGTRGLAAALRRGVNSLWGIPLKQRDAFPHSAVKNIVIILVGGLGFIVAAAVAGYIATAGPDLWLRLLSFAADAFVLYWVFTFLLVYCLPKPVPTTQTWPAALAAAIGLLVLQFVGGYLLHHVLKHLDALYSYFALSLGLLFWIYLQAQVVYYALEIAIVKNNKLWPRSLTGHHTAADERSTERAVH